MAALPCAAPAPRSTRRPDGRDAMALEVAQRMAEAAAIKTSRVHANRLRALPGHVAMGTIRLRTSFAPRYEVVGEQDTAIAREGAVREAFNCKSSP